MPQHELSDLELIFMHWPGPCTPLLPVALMEARSQGAREEVRGGKEKNELYGNTQLISRTDRLIFTSDLQELISTSQ